MESTKEAIQNLQRVNEQIKSSMGLFPVIEELQKEIISLKERIVVLENGQSQAIVVKETKSNGKSTSKGKSNSKKGNRVVPVKRLVGGQGRKDGKVRHK